MNAEERAELLKGLGMDTVAEKILKKKGGKEKLLKAVGNYRYATGEEIDEFNKELRSMGKELAIVPIKDYEKLPPDEVLAALKKAQDDKCFDTFHISYIRRVKDPILFGKIHGFDNLYFFIAQWGDDVKIEDIIGSDE